MKKEKIKLDKYYTPKEIAEYCFLKTKEILKNENITEYLEPSAGAGVFLDFLDKPYLAYDIEPEDDRILKQDFLTLDLPYKKGRCIIGNPPFGHSNHLANKFFKKSIHLGDYIVFILPISQLDNLNYFYEFDLIYSEDLKPQKYSNVKVHCCLNIYKKPENGFNVFVDRRVKNMEDVKLRGVANTKTSYRTRNDKIPEVYDFSICSFGSVGKICDHEDQYVQQTYFTVNPKFKEEVFEKVKNADFKKLYNLTQPWRLKNYQIFDFLQKNIDGIK